MAEVLATVVALVLCYTTLRDYSKGTILSYLVSVYIVPGYANVMGGIRFKFVVLGVIIISAFLNRIKINNNPFYKQALFYFSYSVILCFFSSYVPLSIQLAFLVKQWIYIFLFGLLLWPALKKEKELLFFLKVFYVVIFFSVVMGILEYLFSFNIFRTMFDSGTDITYYAGDRMGLSGRICVATANPLDWGQCCIILLAMSIALRKMVLQKWQITVLSFLLFLNCILAGSRSSIFPIVVLIFFITLFKMKDTIRRHKGRIIGVLSIILIVFLNLSPTDRGYVAAVMMPWNSEASKDAQMGGSSVELRERQLENSIDFVGTQNIMVGMGYGLVHNRPEDDGDLFDEAFGLESVVFVTVIEQGIIGLICFCFLYFFLYRTTVKFTQKREVKFLIQSLFLCYMISILLTGIRSSLQLFFTMLVVFLRYEYLCCKQIGLEKT